MKTDCWELMSSCSYKDSVVDLCLKTFTLENHVTDTWHTDGMGILPKHTMGPNSSAPTANNKKRQITAQSVRLDFCRMIILLLCSSHCCCMWYTCFEVDVLSWITSCVVLSYFWEWPPPPMCLWGTAMHWFTVLILWWKHWLSIRLSKQQRCPAELLPRITYHRMASEEKRLQRVKELLLVCIFVCFKLEFKRFYWLSWFLNLACIWE